MGPSVVVVAVAAAQVGGGQAGRKGGIPKGFVCLERLCTHIHSHNLLDLREHPSESTQGGPSLRVMPSKIPASAALSKDEQRRWPNVAQADPLHDQTVPRWQTAVSSCRG